MGAPVRADISAEGMTPSADREHAERARRTSPATVLRAIRTADISRLAEARLITERVIRSDVVRIRNGCAHADDGAIAVGRAAQNGRF